MPFCDDISQVIIHIIHIATHQLHVLRSVVMWDKTFQQEFLRTLRIDVLCQSDTTCQSAINKDSHSTFVREGHIIKILHYHTLSPHQQRGYHEHGHNLRLAQLRDNLNVLSLHHKRVAQGDDHRYQTTIGHSHQVNEAREPYHTRVGAEQAEAQHGKECVND